MAFDPDAYLAGAYDAPNAATGFDPDAYLAAQPAMASTFATPSDLANYARTHNLATGDNGQGAWGDDTTSDEPMVALPRDVLAAQFGSEDAAHGAPVQIMGPNGVPFTAKVADKMPATSNIKNGAGIDLNPAAAKLAGHPGDGLAPVRWRFAGAGDATGGGNSGGFDPDAYLAATAPATPSPAPFDPDAYLASTPAPDQRVLEAVPDMRPDQPAQDAPNILQRVAGDAAVLGTTAASNIATGIPRFVANAGAQALETQTPPESAGTDLEKRRLEIQARLADIDDEEAHQDGPVLEPSQEKQSLLAELATLTPQGQASAQATANLAAGARQVASNLSATQADLNQGIENGGMQGPSKETRIMEGLGDTASALAPGIGLLSIASQASNSARDSAENAAKAQGLAPDAVQQAGDDAANKAVLTTAATLPPYMLAGAGASALTDKITPEAVGAIRKFLTEATLGTAGNVVASAGVRAAQGDPVLPTLEGFLGGDLPFALAGAFHSLGGEHGVDGAPAQGADYSDAAQADPANAAQPISPTDTQGAPEADDPSAAGAPPPYTAPVFADGPTPQERADNFLDPLEDDGSIPTAVQFAPGEAIPDALTDTPSVSQPDGSTVFYDPATHSPQDFAGEADGASAPQLPPGDETGQDGQSEPLDQQEAQENQEPEQQAAYTAQPSEAEEVPTPAPRTPQELLPLQQRWMRALNMVAPGTALKLEVIKQDALDSMFQGQHTNSGSADLSSPHAAYLDGVIYLSDRALKENPDNINRVNFLHEVAHHFENALPDADRQALRDQWQREVISGDSPLHDEDGALLPDVDPRVENDFHEWLAERIAWDNERHFAGDLDPALAQTPTARLAARVRQFVGHVWKALRPGMPPSELSARFRDWLGAGAGESEPAGRASISAKGPAFQEMRAGNATVSGPALFVIRAHHGTPHEVDRFSLDKVGTGEGAQVYGHGLYFAERPEVATEYQKGLTKHDFDRKIKAAYGADEDDPFDRASPAEAERVLRSSGLNAGQQRLLDALEKEGNWGFDYPHQAVDAALHYWHKFNPGPDVIDALNSFGNLYTVHLDAEPGELLDWDKPISEQSDRLKPVVDWVNSKARAQGRGNIVSPEDTGADLYRRAEAVSTGPEAVSAKMAELGVPGIQYLDQGSRGKENGTRNYVMFDDSRIKITAKNGQPVEGPKFAVRNVVDANGVHSLAKPIGEEYKSEDERQRDPANVLASLVRGSDDADSAQRWKHGREIASHSSLLAHTAEVGREIDPATVQAALSAAPEGYAGGEHVVHYDPESGRIVKYTKPGLYGAQGEDAGAYLQRWALHNRVFGDDAKFEGTVHLPGEDEPRAVISQPFVRGRDSTPEEQADYLRSKGFQEIAPGRWTHPTTGVTAWDTATPGNAITTPEGRVQPVDLQAAPATPAELRLAREKSGIGGDPQFSVRRVVQGAKELQQSSEQKDRIAAGKDAAETRAGMIARQASNSVQLDFPDAADRAAMPFVIEAGGDKRALAQDLAKVRASSDRALAIKYDPIVQHAIDNFDRLNALKGNYEAITQRQMMIERRHGIDTPAVENYVTRVLDQPENKKALEPVLLGSGFGGSGGNRYFTKGRAFEKLSDAIQAGYPPKSTDIADLLERRVGSGQRLVQSRRLFNELRSTPAPGDPAGRPIIGQLETRKTLKGKTEQVVPPGYSLVQAGGAPLVVHKQYAGLFKALYGDSRIRDSAAGRLLLNATGIAKHGTLMLDTFHVSRVMVKEAAFGYQAGYKRGTSILEYGDKDLSRAVAQGDISQAQANYARSMRPMANELIKAGLNVGRVMDNLSTEAVQHFPVVGTFNNWVFGQLSRGAMLQTALTNFQRNLSRFPELGRDGAARRTAREMNEVFGNLGNQGLFKNKTLQDLARVTFLAPQWVESQVRAEGRGVAQLARIPLDLARGKLRMGTVAQGMVSGVVGMLAANQVINLMTRGQFTWQNQEDGRKLDAFIPGGKRGFWFDPFEIAAETMFQMHRLMARYENPVDAGTQIVSNKLSPLARGVKDMLTGRDYAGRPFLTQTDRVRAALLDAAPFPMPLNAIIEKDPRQVLGLRLSRQPGSIEKQVMQSIGMKLQNELSPQQKMFAIAQPFRADRQGYDAAGQYTELRRDLDNDELDGAKSEIQRLIGNAQTPQDRAKALAKIAAAMGIKKDGEIAPEKFTANKVAEQDLIKSLTPAQWLIYQQAQLDHKMNAMKFQRIAASLQGGN